VTSPNQRLRGQVQDNIGAKRPDIFSEDVEIADVCPAGIKVGTDARETKKIRLGLRR